MLLLLCPLACAADEQPALSPNSAKPAPDTVTLNMLLAPALRVKVSALRSTVLSSQMPGRILELAVRDGDSFAKGQILARLDCAVPAAQLKRAEATHHKQLTLYETTAKLERLRSRSPLELAMTRAELAQAAAELSVAKSMLERCTILAPFSGKVSERMVHENQYVNEGQALFEIMDPSELELEFIAPSAWLPWFVPGYLFIVQIDETQGSYQASLSRLGGKVDAVSQSIKAYARFISQDEKLLPGMSGAAHIEPPSFAK